MNLNSREDIAILDKSNVLGSVESLPDQCLHAWEDASRVEVPDYYKDIQNIVMCGMGGSGLGARVIESVYGANITMPLVRIHDYHLPGFTGIHTLVICSSYSGNTEETVQNAQEAVERQAKWMAIGTGNSLIDLANEHGVPYYKIDPKNNPSNQPRMAIGYSIVGQLVLASKIGLFNLTKEEVDQVASSMREVINANKVEVETAEAKTLAGKMKDKIVIYFSSEHLVGSTHTINNQLNENAKNLSADHPIPELNHHLMEGLVHPAENPDDVLVVLINSDLYSDRLKQRYAITKQVVEKIGITSFEVNLKTSTKLTQAFELIQFGAYANFYLAMLYGIDPAPIPWVDYFKERLGQPLGK